MASRFTIKAPDINGMLVDIRGDVVPNASKGFSPETNRAFEGAKTGLKTSYQQAKSSAVGVGKGLYNMASAIMRNPNFPTAGITGIMRAKPLPIPQKLEPSNKDQKLAMRLFDIINNPGSELLTPELKKHGVPSAIAGGFGLIGDIVAPGPGELKTLSKPKKAVESLESITSI